MINPFDVREKADRDRKKGDILPDPPDYARWNLNIPPFYASYHPYTKWMLNMIRGNAIHRLATMIKERPIIFRHYFQVADSPEILTNDHRDHICMFHRRCVLYFTPLCLAVYLKRDKVVDILMKSGLNNPYQSCFATEVFITKPADILEICAACVALKREFFQALPLLCQNRSNSDNSCEIVTLKIDEPICLRYVTIDAKRFFRYQDLLHYGTELLQRNANYPINRLVECLFIDCCEFFDANKLREDAKGEPLSFFRRLARFAFYQDDLCRISLPIIVCLETMIRNFCVPWKSRPAGRTCAEDPDFILKHLQRRNELILDQDASLLLLCGLYHKLRSKSRGMSRLNQLGQVIHKMLAQMHWLPVFQNITLEDLQLISKDINECIPMTKQTLFAMQHHVSTIDEMEKMREIVINNDLRSRRERTRGFRKSRSHSAMPHPMLAEEIDGVPKLIGKDQPLPSIQQVTRARRPEPMIQPQEGPTIFKYQHGVERTEPPRRRGRGFSAPNSVRKSSFANGAVDGPGLEARPIQLSSARGFQLKEKPRFIQQPPDGLGDQEITSVTDWTDFDSLMKSPTITPTFALPRRRRSQVTQPQAPRTAFKRPLSRRPNGQSHRRSSSWDGRDPKQELSGSANRRWREYSGYRSAGNRSAIDAYENFVLGAMFEDYECDTSSQGDFGLPQHRWIHRAAR